MTRILFTANPLPGHFLPLLTLARHAADTGHDIALMTGAPLADFAKPLRFIPVGPDWAELQRENAKRHPGKIGSIPPPVEAPPSDVGDLFAGTRLELAGDDAVRAAREFAPDLVICEATDATGPLIAAALDIPWATQGFGTEMPPPFFDALHAKAVEFHSTRGLEYRPRCAYVDPWPPSLRPDGAFVSPDRVPLTLDVDASPGAAWTAPPLTGPRVLVTLGTSVEDADALATSVRSVLSATDADVIVTRGALDHVGVDDPRVIEVGFVRFTDLLDTTDVVVAAGGAGTVLGTARARLPMVILPFYDDQHWSGEALTRVGAGETAENPADVGALVKRLLDDPAYRRAAGTLAEEIEGLGPPAAALDTILARANLADQ